MSPFSYKNTHVLNSFLCEEGRWSFCCWLFSSVTEFLKGMGWENREKVFSGHWTLLAVPVLQKTKIEKAVENLKGRESIKRKYVHFPSCGVQRDAISYDMHHGSCLIWLRSLVLYFLFISTLQWFCTKRYTYHWIVCGHSSIVRSCNGTLNFFFSLCIHPKIDSLFSVFIYKAERPEERPPRRNTIRLALRAVQTPPTEVTLDLQGTVESRPTILSRGKIKLQCELSTNAVRYGESLDVKLSIENNSRSSIRRILVRFINFLACIISKYYWIDIKITR